MANYRGFYRRTEQVLFLLNVPPQFNVNGFSYQGEAISLSATADTEHLDFTDAIRVDFSTITWQDTDHMPRNTFQDRQEQQRRAQLAAADRQRVERLRAAAPNPEVIRENTAVQNAVASEPVATHVTFHGDSTSSGLARNTWQDPGHHSIAAEMQRGLQAAREARRASQELEYSRRGSLRDMDSATMAYWRESGVMFYNDITWQPSRTVRQEPITVSEPVDTGAPAAPTGLTMDYLESLLARAPEASVRGTRAVDERRINPLQTYRSRPLDNDDLLRSAYLTAPAVLNARMAYAFGDGPASDSIDTRRSTVTNFFSPTEKLGSFVDLEAEAREAAELKAWMENSPF